MCTVTYLPPPGGAFLTSNRDERTRRAPAEPPITRYAGDALTYPTDAQTGGKWIALKGRQDAAVLLNGGFANHERKPSYWQSRGIAMLEIIRAASPAACFETMQLKEIEPFTPILFTDGELTRCTWDGTGKHRHELDAKQPHIWASATLYGHDAQQMRTRHHSRGAKFLDLSHRITPSLTRVIDQLCASIPGFYFGRLDIRFKSWGEPKQGNSFRLSSSTAQPANPPTFTILGTLFSLRGRKFTAIGKSCVRSASRTHATAWQG